VPTLEGVTEIGQRLMAAFPDLADAPVLAAWAGLRPASEDENAYIGPINHIEGLMLAAGHSHHGVMIAPWTGRVIAALARGENRPDWAPFLASRLSV
jgi:glycine/D-amino acid oxidase-like deaminating enzyme